MILMEHINIMLGEFNAILYWGQKISTNQWLGMTADMKIAVLIVPEL
jgi:hypothetical protein